MTSRRSVLRTVGLLALAGVAVTAGCARYRAGRAEEAYPPEGDFVEVDGARVHYVQAGEGPDVILLHGAGGNLRDFTFDFMDRLTDRYRVTAFDRPGLGYTDRVPGTPRGPLETEAEPPRAQARLLRGAAEALGITDPVLVGHSFGGIVSYGWAVEALDTESPANPSAIVSLAGVTLPWPGELGAYYRVNGSPLGGAVTIPLISAFVPQGTVAEAIENTFTPQPAPDGYAEHIGAGLTLRPRSMRANIRQVNSLRPHVVEMEKRYPELTLPVEIVHGTLDDTVPIDVHARPFTERFGEIANLTELEGVGHMPHHVDPEAAAAAIDRAVARAGLR